MNQSQPYMDMHSSHHISSAQPYTPQSATAPGIPQYPHYQSPQVMHSGATHYSSTPHNYGTYAYPNGVQSPQSANQPSSAHSAHAQNLPLPAMMTGPPSQHSYIGGGNSAHAYGTQPPHQFDQTGQVAPPGMKPRVTATLWEDEGSLCFQVEAKGVCVARREDNHMINGTKLLNVAGMTRGRRDGILKSEKVRHVVKIGPMHLKGVWIPFERALDFANKEKITDQLYPLFVHNIGGLLYHPTNETRTSAVVQASERRRVDTTPLRNGQSTQPPSLHHHSMQSTVGSQVPPTPHSIAPHPGSGRPPIERAQTFPTPPTSASSVMGMGNQGSSYEWGAPNMSNGVTGAQALSIDTGLSNARSLPTTPASTPPGSSISNMQQYHGQQNFNDSKSFYSGPPSSQGAYASQSGAQPNMTRYSSSMHSAQYPKHEMGPPSAPGAVSTGEGEHHEIKSEQYPNGHVSTDSTDPETNHQSESGYMGSNGAAYTNSRSQYAYNPPPSASSVQSEHPHLPSELTESPHQAGSGRATPRDANGNPQWTQGYSTPPRTSTSSNLYSVMSDSRGTNGTPTGDHYGAAYTAASINGSLTSTKRARDDDSDGGRPESRGMETGFDLKRRKTTMGLPLGQVSSLQSIKTGGAISRPR